MFVSLYRFGYIPWGYMRYVFLSLFLSFKHFSCNQNKEKSLHLSKCDVFGWHICKMRSREDSVRMMNKAIGVCKPNTHHNDETLMSITAALLSHVRGLESLISARRLHPWAFVSSCVYVITPLCCSPCWCVNDFNCPHLRQAYIWQRVELYARDSLFKFSMRLQIYHPKHKIKTVIIRGEMKAAQILRANPIWDSPQA